MSYSDEVLRFSPLLLPLMTLAVSCVSAPPTPSTPEQRTPSPSSITRDNPGGDAENPVDAALQRLVKEPFGQKDDKFLTLLPKFADVRNWKRVRFWGQPTRAGFRYGKDPYAFAVVLYSESQNDDPAACLKQAMARGQRLADAFDIRYAGFVYREVQYPPGLEGVDLLRLERESELAYQRDEERRRARSKRRGSSAAKQAPKAAPDPKWEERRRARIRDNVLHGMIEELPKATLKVATTRAKMETLTNRNTYLAATVAYPSWPGTCLVQGYAVRVGSDETLARAALDRWIEEQAPKLEWRHSLQGPPPIENR